MIFSINNIKYDDYATWQLFKSGKTIGVFQCESNLVQSWLKKIKPNNIWELSAVIALVRPGALDSGMANQYVKNKESLKSESFGNDIIDNVFKSTNSVLTYQEQLLLLGQRLAWSDLPENERLLKSDNLRKAVGKKLQSEILTIGKEFTAGCIKNGLSQEIADRLFEIIKSCGRYLFNLSHSISYAYLAYHTAYLKTHYPKEFFLSSLNFSQEKGHFEEEMHNLIQDAKSTGFTILPPNINKKNLDFILEDTGLRYGLKFIKFVGTSLNDKIQQLPPIYRWQDIIKLDLVGLNDVKLRSNNIDALIWSNAFVDTNIDRYQLFNIINFCRCLTEREYTYLLSKIDNLNNIYDIPKIINEIAVVVANKKRKQILESESIILQKNLENKSSPITNEQKERFYLQSIISESSVGKLEKFSTHNCFALNQIFSDDNIPRIITVCVIDNVMHHIIKTGKNIGKTMAKITIHDSSGEYKNIPIFSDKYNKYSDILVPGAIVQLSMSYNERYKLAINDVTQICY